jgi:hypothetical protein
VAESGRPSEDVLRRARDRRRRAARRYRPARVDLLLVAEAPPEAIDRYFYFPEVVTQDSLFRYVCRAVLGKEPTRAGKRLLLDELRERSVFLVDLQPEPFDERPLRAMVPALVKYVQKLNPGWIVLIKADVFDVAYAPLAAAGLPVSDVRVPFPGSGQQRRFVEAFAQALRQRPRAPARRGAAA